MPYSLITGDQLHSFTRCILAKRLKTGLNEIIHKSQYGFISSCHMSNNILLVFHQDLLDGSPLILFLDFQKAFDTVSHNFIFNTVNFFIKAIKTLYSGNNSSVKLHYPDLT